MASPAGRGLTGRYPLQLIASCGWGLGQSPCPRWIQLGRSGQACAHELLLCCVNGSSWSLDLCVFHQHREVPQCFLQRQRAGMHSMLDHYLLDPASLPLWPIPGPKLVPTASTASSYSSIHPSIRLNLSMEVSLFLEPRVLTGQVQHRHGTSGTC